MEPIDSMAYIGKNPGDDNIYIITGDSGNGMTHGTLGGIIITEPIGGINFFVSISLIEAICS